MTEKVTYLTRKKYEELKDELKYLREVKKPEISKRIGVAADHGDLSENFEYDAAKEMLQQTMIRIKDISNKLTSARIFDEEDIDPDKVYIGATVKLQDLDLEEEETFTIVGADEADPMEGRISVESPIADGLLGKKAGDFASIKTPSGTVKYKIIKISR